MDRGIKKVQDFLKDQKTLVVPFDKGCGFCVQEKITISLQNLSASPFEARIGESDNLTVKTEKEIYISLNQIKNTEC